MIYKEARGFQSAPVETSGGACLHLPAIRQYKSISVRVPPISGAINLLRNPQ